MGLRINNNLEAQNALRQLNINQMSFSKSMQRISSGKRVNSAADDAAGYAISNKLHAQANGLDQASSNAQDGISMIQTASGGLQTTMSLLQRFRQLAVQSTNDTNTSSDRTQLQSEANQISNEITQIASTTQFNTKNLLDGAQATTSTYTGGTAGAVTVSGFDTTKTGATTVAGSGLANGTVNFSLAKTGAVTSDGSAGTVTLNGTTYKLDLTTFTTSTSTAAGNTEYTINGTAPSGVTGFKIDVAGKAGGASGSDATLAVAGTPATGSYAVTGASVATTTGGVTLQVGANADQNLNVSISAMDSFSLGVSASGTGNAAAVYAGGVQTSAAKTTGALDITTQANANTAITTIDKAIDTVNTQSASLGAVQNRLSSAMSNLAIGSENMTAAYSNITNVNMAQESTSLATAQILQQAATSMLAQANQAPQGVLKLLG